MNFIENIKIPKGFLEIVVTDTKTGELIRRDRDHNQIQNWARHALSYLSAGRLFCTWGNHGEQVNDVGTYSIPHLNDGADGTQSGDYVTQTPWSYSSEHSGLIQVRNFTEGDLNQATTTLGDPLYPFFPTKMRFGIGGLDADQNPRTDIDSNETSLQNTLDSFPYIVVDRARSDNAHISVTSSDSLDVGHKITYSVKLPGGDSSYPYNGYVISEAGLFADAALSVPVGGSQDLNMRTGVLWAYRTFFGITKNESIDVTFNWTFVF